MLLELHGAHAKIQAERLLLGSGPFTYLVMPIANPAP